MKVFTRIPIFLLGINLFFSIQDTKPNGNLLPVIGLIAGSAYSGLGMYDVCRLLKVDIEDFVNDHFNEMPAAQRDAFRKAIIDRRSRCNLFTSGCNLLMGCVTINLSWKLYNNKLLN